MAQPAVAGSAAAGAAPNPSAPFPVSAADAVGAAAADLGGPFPSGYEGFGLTRLLRHRRREAYTSHRKGPCAPTPNDAPPPPSHVAKPALHLASA